MAGVQRRGIEHQHRYFVTTLPIVLAWVKTFFFVRRLYVKTTEESLIFVLAIVNAAVELGFIQLPHVVSNGVVAAERGFQVITKAGDAFGAQVLLHPGKKIFFYTSHQVDVVLLRNVFIGFSLK